MDIFVAGAIVFLILFGASTIGTPTTLAWIVALIGGLQVLFMNLINGTIKDIDHDEEGMANTLAIRLGAKTDGVMPCLSHLKQLDTSSKLEAALIFIPFLVSDAAVAAFSVADCASGHFQFSFFFPFTNYIQLKYLIEHASGNR